MHIAIIAPEAIPVPPRMGGSVEVCILSIARELAKNHQVTVYSRTHPAYPKHQREGGITFVRVQGGVPSSYIVRVLKAMKGASYDCIQVDNRPKFVPLVKKQFPDTPILLFMHSLTFVSSTNIRQAHAALCLRSADRIIVNSDSLRRELEKRFPSVRPIIKRVHLGVDTERFRPPHAGEREALRKRYKLSGTFAVAFAGRMIPKKGIPVLLKAIRQVRVSCPKVKLIIAGAHGPSAYRSRIRQMAVSLKVPVTHLGYVSHRRMHQVYRMADCFVCPSQKHEPFGLVNTEAMSSGIPCIGSSNGGIREIIRDGHNGYLINDYHNPAAFAFAIQRLAQNPELTQKLGKQARLDALNRFSWKHTAKNMESLYRSVCKNHS